MSNRLSAFRSAVLLAVICAQGLPFASAQSGERENGELAAFGAVGFGAGTRPAFGGSAGASFSRYGMGLFEFGFMPMGNHTIQPWPAQSTVKRSVLYDFGVDFHLRIPVRDRWEPYAIIGTGLLWNSVSQNSSDLQGAAVVNHYDQFNGALHTGGGVRYFIGKNWGIRPEAKVIVSKDVYTRLSIGLFIVVPTDWP
jgi:hypothetical protein